MFVCTKGVKLSTKKSKVKIMGELKSVFEFSEGRILKCHIVLHVFKKSTCTSSGRPKVSE